MLIWLMIYDAWEWYAELWITYLFEASILDAQFFSIDKIKQLSVLFSKGRNEEDEISGLRGQLLKHCLLLLTVYIKVVRE